MEKSQYNFWLKPKEFDAIARGEVNGMDQIDLMAAREGQAIKKMRSYSRKSQWWKI